LAYQLVKKGKQADLLIANNVLAHVPDINDFVGGFSLLLKPTGIATFEFPHLNSLISKNQFDTIYHEHFSYLSLVAVKNIFENNGLTIFDVEEIPTHGGSLRVYAQKSDSSAQEISDRVSSIINMEIGNGVFSKSYYAGFQINAERIKNDFCSFLIDARRNDQTVAAYGAAAKGNTLLNFAGVRKDLVSFVVDKNPAKKGKFMPGSRIPIVDESMLKEKKPEYVVIFPWNLKEEIMDQLDYIKAWDGKFVTAIPSLSIV